MAPLHRMDTDEYGFVPDERQWEAFRRFAEGVTLARIAKDHGVSRERARWTVLRVARYLLRMREAQSK